MKNLITHIRKIALLGILGSILITCQKEDQMITTKVETEKNAVPPTAENIPGYLQDLIGLIENMVSDGVLNKGQGNALMSKVNNAIKSINKGSKKHVENFQAKAIAQETTDPGNTNAAIGQLNAFINQVEALIENGSIGVEAGQLLINTVEKEIIILAGSFIDERDGLAYNVVQIGDQLWMAENLRATKFNDGTDISLVTDNSEWTNLSTPAYCWYDNDEVTYGEAYGALYNWFTVETGNLCPTDWHVPTISEASDLVDYLTNNGYGYEGSGDDVAKSMASTSGWNLSTEVGSPGNDQSSNNSSGFSGLPAGVRGGPNDGDGMFLGLGHWGWWWTASELALYNAAHDIRLNVWTSKAQISSYYKEAGAYVRCLKD